jgi:hypothetical protein
MEPDTIVKNGASLKSHTSRVNNNRFTVTMKKSFLGVIVACVAILFCSCGSSKSLVNSGNSSNQLIGVWKNVTPDAIEMIKTITKERWIWIYTHEGKIVYSLGGSYTFDGETYTENIEYGTPNMDSYYFGEKTIFKVKFEGNKMYTAGRNQKETYDQVWELVE